MTTKRLVLLLATLVLIALLHGGIYVGIPGGPTMMFRLNRWTGRVVTCAGQGWATCRAAEWMP